MIYFRNILDILTLKHRHSNEKFNIEHTANAICISTNQNQHQLKINRNRNFVNYTHTHLVQIKMDSFECNRTQYKKKTNYFCSDENS